MIKYPEPVAVTKKLLESRYDDNSTYYKNYKKPEIEQGIDVYNIDFLESLATSDECPEIEYEEIECSCPGIVHPKSNVQQIEFELTKEMLDGLEGKNLFICNQDAGILANAELLKDDFIDGVKYFAPTDTFVIPFAIKQFIEKNGKQKVHISIYNWDMRKIHRKEFSECTSVKLPKLKFKGFPKTIKMAKFKEKKYIPNKFCLYINLPYEYYRNCVTDSEYLAYNINAGYYIGHSGCNESKLNHLVYDIAVNGLQQPIQFKILQNGNVMPLASNKRVLAAEYLGLPYIPAIVLLDQSPDKSYSWFYESKDVIDMANEMFAPYFIFE